MSNNNTFRIGDWVVYEYRDHDYIPRAITGKVTAVDVTVGSTSGLITVRSDGGQPGFRRGAKFSVFPSDLKHSGSPYAPSHS